MFSILTGILGFGLGVITVTVVLASVLAHAVKGLIEALVGNPAF